MAFFSVDPRPHAPRGFDVVPNYPKAPPLVLSVYIGRMESYNEDLAIAYMVPKVNKVDFEPMAMALKDFFARTYGVHLTKVQSCPIGDAYIRFHSPVEREWFLDKIVQFRPNYQIHFAKNDEGRNARFQYMDREAWIMLMPFL